MADNAAPLKLPIELITMPRLHDAVFNGKIYVGKPDTDPTGAGNRVNVYQEGENGALTPIAQPISISAGGYPTVGGQAVKLVVTQDYSVAVYDRLGAQVYYFPRCAGPYVLSIFHDQTLHGNGTAADVLGVQLSKNAGNLLEIRDDGLYYGTTATDNLLNLYVDAENGDDGNTGTRAAPLKTLNRALEITPDDKTNTIHLRAGQTFILDRNARVNACTRTIRPYDDPWIDGDKVPPISPQNPAYDGHCVAALARPVLKSHINYYELNQTFSLYTFNVSAGGSLNFLGLVIDSVPDNDEQKTGWIKDNAAPVYGNASGSVTFRGCYLVSKPKTENIYSWVVVSNIADGGYPSLKFSRCQLLSGQYFIGLGGVAATITITDEWPTQYGVPYFKGNLKQATLDGKLNGILRGPGGEPRNLTINFVV